MYWERLSTLKLMKKNNYYQHFLNLEKQLLHNTYITNISYIHTMPDQQSTSIQRHDANSLLSNLRLNIMCPHGNNTVFSKAAHEKTAIIYYTVQLGYSECEQIEPLFCDR